MMRRLLVIMTLALPSWAQYVPPGGGGATGITGTLTSGTVPVASAAHTIANSSVTDNGTTVQTTEPLCAGASCPSASGIGASSYVVTGCGTVTGTSSAGSMAIACNSGTYTPQVSVNGGPFGPLGSNYNGFGMWNLTVPLLANFSWVNQQLATAVTGTHFMSLLNPAQASNQRAVLNQACPIAPWDLYVLFNSSSQNESGSAGGVEIDDGTKYQIFQEVWTSSGASLTLGVYNYSALNTYSSTVASGLIYGGPYLWLHVNNTAGALTYTWSYDGVYWIPLASSETYLSANTNCGIATSSTSSYGVSGTAYSWSYGALTAQ